MRIEAPPEGALAVTTPTLPAAIMPLVTAKSMVQVGLLDPQQHSAAGSSLPGRRMVTGGFDTRAAGASESARRLTSAGFDGGGPPDPTVTKGRATLSNAGFDQADAPLLRATVAKAVSAPFEGIEILEKPRPVYTEEARRLRIEGTVQLRVVFGAAGQIRVVSVVKGLGYGLDEAAVQAAVAIRFRPARRDGRPVDAPAVIQIEFQIA